jgi:hypothetical protein
MKEAADDNKNCFTRKIGFPSSAHMAYACCHEKRPGKAWVDFRQGSLHFSIPD